ncbi:MAG: hypothetical protein OXO52_09575 [Rhodospirillales bacterium]|nr:hypothetical protein [Rhodospirillales bacterium]MDE0380690.1 hypothetical protein [Rhodospirillales bacterium]
MSRSALTSIAAVASVVALLALAACGGGGSDTQPSTDEGAPPPETGPDPTPEPGPEPTPDPAPEPAPEPVPDLVLPDFGIEATRQTPVIQFGNELRIGGMPPPGQGELASVATHAEATVRYGRSQDGVGATRLTEYLGADTSFGDGVILRFVDAPVVRFVEGTTIEQIDEIVRAVQLLNANLPRDFQLTVDPTPVSEAAVAPGIGTDPTMADGQILVEYDRREDWEESAPSDETVGIAAVTYVTTGEISTVRVWVDHTRLDDSMAVLVHELIHALGRDHADEIRFPSTVMHEYGVGTEGYVMYQLDREALLAVYSVIEAGNTPSEIATNLGAWEDESLHVRGDLGDLAFGASLRNGLVRPWALGPRPGIDLADNPQLMGSAVWTGRLLGLTPSGETVAGAADLDVDLSSLDGDLDFTSLESWSGAPGALGTGTMWGDGDLSYDITVEGNVFARIAPAGGDEGVISGAFFGASHDGMGGTLVRDDLGAGFAGTR